MKTFHPLALAVLAGLAATSAAAAEPKGQVLVLLSSENQLALKDGQHYATGYYLNEFGVPADRFGIYFGITEPVRTWSDALGHDHELNRRFTAGCFERGVYFHAYTRQGPPGHAG